MKILKILILLASIFSILACQTETSSNSTWEIVYKNDKEGSKILGSKAKLINAIRQGLPIRIAWGSKGKKHSIEHISEPIWIAILDETEVIAHIDPQVLSSVDWEDLTADYADSTKLTQEWRVVLTTKGEFDAVWYDRATHQQIRRVPQKHVMSWFVQNWKADDAKPFFEQ